MSTFEQTRRELIAFRVANADNPALSHRASLAVNLLEQLRAPVSESHKQRLLIRLSQVMQEIEAIKANGGIFTPSMMRAAA